MSFSKTLLASLNHWSAAPVASAHCDGPCGVYDPASARIAGEAVLSMTKKLVDLGDDQGLDSENTRTRYIAIKEEQAELVKRELNILWHDYFKPAHLEAYPDLHTTFWNAAKQASACKTSVSVDAANELMAQIEAIHNMFWATKNRDVAWVTAS
ncbi:MAG: superoxide dismutase, Ni [Acidimicrobiales bacterium]|nr:superoxide dismutase, Ni [Acidimicrobiales bacterium]